MTKISQEPGQEPFKLNPDAEINGISHLDSIDCPPSCLVELFGKPREADGQKVSGQYVFEGTNGDVFTVYEWKETSLYWGSDNDAPTPEEFWESDESCTLMIGGHRNVSPEQFLDWLVQRWKEHEDRMDLLQGRLEAAAKKAGDP